MHLAWTSGLVGPLQAAGRGTAHQQTGHEVSCVGLGGAGLCMTSAPTGGACAVSPTLTCSRSGVGFPGVLLGAGAYGRVYRGRWRGMAVAVKVIDHEVNTAMAVMNEVKLVTSFNHPNVVRAYYSATWVSRPPPPPSTARQEGSPAATRGPSSALNTTSTASQVAMPAAASSAAGASVPPPHPPSTSSHVGTAEAGGTAGPRQRGLLPRPPSPAGASNLPAVAEEAQAGGSQASVSTPTHNTGAPASPFAGPSQQTPSRDAAAANGGTVAGVPPAGAPPPPSPGGSTSSSTLDTGQVVKSVYAVLELPSDGDLPEDLQDLAPVGGLGGYDPEGGEQQQAAAGDSCTGLSFWVNRQPTLSTAAAIPSHPYQQMVSSTAPPVMQPGGAAAAVALLAGSGSAAGAGSGAGTASLSEPNSMAAAGGGKAPAPAGASSSPLRHSPPPSPPAATPDGAAAPGPGPGGGTGLRRRGNSGEGRAQTWLVLELCSGGTLQDVLDSGSSNTVRWGGGR